MIVFLIAYVGVGIPMAINEMGVWSLAAAMLTQHLVQAILTYLVVRHSLVPVFEWKYFKSLYAFGSRVSLIGFVEFLSSSIDTMLIGRYLGDRLLGFYNRAFMVVNLPIEYLSGSFSKVLFPAFSKIQHDRVRLRKVYLSSFSLLVYLILAVSIGMVAAADTIVLVLLGKGWEPVIPILRLLAIAAGINFLSHYGGIVCEATARLRGKFKLQLTYLVLLSAGLFFTKQYGILYMAGSLLLAQIIRHFAYILVVKSILEVPPSDLFRTYYPGMITAFLIGIPIYLTGLFLGQMKISVYIILSVQVLIGAFGLVLFLKLKLNHRLRIYLFNRLAQNIQVGPKNAKGKIITLLIKYLRVPSPTKK